MKEWITSHLMSIAIGGGLILAVPLLKYGSSVILKKFQSMFGVFLSTLFDLTPNSWAYNMISGTLKIDLENKDNFTDFREIVLHACRIAERQIPDSGLGEKKLALVKSWLGRFVKPEFADILTKTIDSAVLIMNDEMKERINDL